MMNILERLLNDDAFLAAETKKYLDARPIKTLISATGFTDDDIDNYIERAREGIRQGGIKMPALNLKTSRKMELPIPLTLVDFMDDYFYLDEEFEKAFAGMTPPPTLIIRRDAIDAHEIGMKANGQKYGYVISAWPAGVRTKAKAAAYAVMTESASLKFDSLSGYNFSRKAYS